MGIYDDLLQVEKESMELWGIYSPLEKQIIEEWNNKIGEKDALNYTVFRDKEFLENFLDHFSQEEGYLYALNTYKYFMKDKSFDPKYVIFTRRAVPSKEPKPEAFWTSEHRVALVGLKNEIPKPQRYYTVIMVTTLDKLLNHGLAETFGGASDGEIVINPQIPFNDFLFLYKPKRENIELAEYINNGGKSCEEVLMELKATADERKEQQGFIK